MSLLMALLIAQASAPGAAEPKLPPGAIVVPHVTCPPSAEETQRLLGLPYTTFDQDMAVGWRPYGLQQCYRDAATLLDAYAQAHADAPFLTIIRWHQFQMLAFAGDKQGALAALEQVKALDEKRRADAGWRHYVAGSQAFIEGRKAELAEAISALEAFAGAQKDGRLALTARLNNNVLRGLMTCFDRPYSEAYQSPCVDMSVVRDINARMQPLLQPEPK